VSKDVRRNLHDAGFDLLQAVRRVDMLSQGWLATYLGKVVFYVLRKVHNVKPSSIFNVGPRWWRHRCVYL